ncbi:hypothetical protein [Pseudomonas saliphila]|uniref:hypothetical protein n=1 Tax=Pseudomonas saliphila TaxID=2586906 RepID=UPI00123A75FA|nr:hypothetical protein [Pseudomonas saliphila]
MIILSLQTYLTFSLVLFLLVPLGPLSTSRRIGVLFGLTVLGMLPLVHGMSPAGYVRGVTDDLACTSMVWLVAAALMRLGFIAPWARPQPLQLWICFAVLGVVLFPAAMGVGMIDTYGWGFTPRPMLIGVAGLTLVMVLLRNAAGAFLLLAATAAFMLDVKPSDNYWDYLLDPFIFLYSLGALAVSGIRWVVSRRPHLPESLPAAHDELGQSGRTNA